MKQLSVFLTASSLLVLTSAPPALWAGAPETKIPQTEVTNAPNASSESPGPGERQAILETIKNFYIGDHTGSLKHKRLSMHPEGAYRYVDKSGTYKESRFNVDSDNADQNYTEELLSIEIYETVALARVRLKQNSRDVAEYKLMTLHKVDKGWLITGISWGFGVIQ